jgi:hypothetical protein
VIAAAELTRLLLPALRAVLDSSGKAALAFQVDLGAVSDTV